MRHRHSTSRHSFIHIFFFYKIIIIMHFKIPIQIWLIMYKIHCMYNKVRTGFFFILFYIAICRIYVHLSHIYVNSIIKYIAKRRQCSLQKTNVKKIKKREKQCTLRTRFCVCVCLYECVYCRSADISSTLYFLYRQTSHTHKMQADWSDAGVVYVRRILRRHRHTHTHTYTTKTKITRYRTNNAPCRISHVY